MVLVRGYQLLLSPWVGGQCRFTPTCSQYTIDALRLHGAARGSYLGAMRIVRCQPWCEGGHDPAPQIFRWASWRREGLPEAMADDADAAPSPPAATATGPRHDAAAPPQV